MSETTNTRRVSVTLPESLARQSKAQAALRGTSYDQFLRESIEDTMQRIKETAATS